MAIPEHQAVDYIYGQRHVFLDGHHELECFGTSSSERFYIKEIAKFEKNLTALFWFVISRIEVFFKVKVAKTWVILTFSPFKDGSTKIKVLANKAEVQRKLNFEYNELVRFCFTSNPSYMSFLQNGSYDEVIERALYRKQFLSGQKCRYDSSSLVNDSLGRVSDNPRLARDLRYSGVTKDQFGEACKEFTDFAAIHQQCWKSQEPVIAMLSGDEKERAQKARTEAIRKMHQYSEFLAKVICRKYEMESRAKELKLSYNLTNVVYDSVSAKINMHIDDALTTTSPRDPSTTVTLRGMNVSRISV